MNYSQKMIAKPDISIAVISYNHEKFIADTFRGIAMQKFSGVIEVVVGDDCSTDKTREMARDFASQQSNVKLLFHTKNGGMVLNWITTIDACSGRYIALCEGDDYWTDPLKLQRQFDLMERHPEYSMIWHPVDVIEEGVQRPYPYAPGIEVADIQAIIRHHFIPTCSLMFRNGLVNSWPKWINKVMSMDIALEMMLAMHGTALRIDNKMGAYRQHPQGISKSNAHVRLGQLRLLEAFKAFNEYSKLMADETVRERMMEITRLQLKIPENRRFFALKQLFGFFGLHLYAVRAQTFQAIRHEIYTHLMPDLYVSIRSKRTKASIK